LLDRYWSVTNTLRWPRSCPSLVTLTELHRIFCRRQPCSGSDPRSVTGTLAKGLCFQLPACRIRSRTSAVRPPACPATAAPAPRRAAPGRPRSVTTRSVTGSPCPCSYTPWVCAPCPQRLLSGTPSFQLASTLWSDGGFSLMGWEEIALRKVLSFWNTSVSTVSKEAKPKSQYHEKFTKKEQITTNCLIAHVKENGQEPTPLLPEGHRSTYQLAIGKSQHLPLFHPINLQLATQYHFQW